MNSEFNLWLEKARESLDDAVASLKNHRNCQNHIGENQGDFSMDRKKIDRIIRIYLKDLSKKIKVKKAILFGSAVSGRVSSDSDIDLLILSAAFTKMSSSERFDLLYTARKSDETQRAAMDIFGLTPRE